MPRNPLRIRSFQLYLSAIFISYFGTGMHFIAISWLILELTGSSTFVGTVLGLSLLPALFFSFPAGVFSDRHNRKWISVNSDLFRFLVVAVVPLIYFLGFSKISPMIILGAELLQAVASPFFTTATAGLVKEVVPAASLLTANRYKEIALQASGLLGAGIAGFLIAAVGSYGVLAIDAATFLASAVLLSMIPHSKINIVPQIKRISVLKLAKEGLTYAHQRPEVMFPVLLSVIPYLIVKSMNVVLGDFVRVVLSSGAREFGWIDAAFAIGTIVASLALSYLSKRIDFNKLVIGMYGLLSCALLFFGASSHVFITIICYLVVGFSVLSVKTLIGTHIQLNTENAFVGRVQGLTTSLQGLIGPIMLSLSGYSADVLSPRVVVIALALLSGASAWAAHHALKRSNAAVMMAQAEAV